MPEYDLERNSDDRLCEKGVGVVTQLSVPTKEELNGQ